MNLAGQTTNARRWPSCTIDLKTNAGLFETTRTSAPLTGAAHYADTTRWAKLRRTRIA